MTNKRVHSGPEERSYFRIDDRVQLHYRTVDEAMLQQQPLDNLPDEEVDAATLTLRLQSLTSQANNALAVIRKGQPDVAQYLSLLERRLDLLTRALVSEYSDAKAQPNITVSLSAGGLSFPSREAIAPETLLRIDLLLFPSQIHIQAYGRVVKCEEQGDKEEASHLVGLNFAQISTMAQEALIKHTLELEATRRRQRREQQDEG